MKKAILIAVVAGLAASGVNAAQLEMWFDKANGIDEITMDTTETVLVEIWVTNMHAQDTLSGLYHENALALGLKQIASIPNVTNWTGGGVNDVLGPLPTPPATPPPGNQFLVSALLASTDSVVGAGDVLVGWQEIHQMETPPPPADYNIEFAPPGFPTQELVDQAGNPWLWWHTATYAGYYTYGKGACYVAGNVKTGLQPVLADPLTVHCIPEPASLSLLVLGGIAALRRRR